LKHGSSLQKDWLAGHKAKRDPVPVSVAEVIRKPTILKAIEYGQECAGLDEKSVYDPLGWKPEVWSRIFTQDPNPKNPAYFDARRLVPFMELTGNDAPLIWLAHQRKFDWTTIRHYESDLERENARLKAELAQVQHDRAVEATLFAAVVARR
jgi:hypothetical protein